MNLPIKILLLDDDPISNLINEKILQITGYDVKVNSFTDAKVALNYLNNVIKFEIDNFPDLIFADINMNGMNGWEFAEKLSVFPDIALNKLQFYMLTSSIAQEDINRTNAYSIITGINSKPLTEEIIVNYISKLIFKT